MNYEELFIKLKDYPPYDKFRVYCPFNKKYYCVTGLGSSGLIYINEDNSIMISTTCMSYKTFSILLQTHLIVNKIQRLESVRFTCYGTEFTVL
jgi:hypothetical protein